MPKSTFYNLSKEKREKIEAAIKNEFGRNSFSKASISNIIQEANIPRGSFYQYFEDKEDAIKYVIEKFVRMEKEEIMNLLKQNDGDIFQTVKDIFLYIIDKNKNNQDMVLCRNILQKLKQDNVNVFEEIKNENSRNGRIKDLINVKLLNIKKEEELKYILKILASIMSVEAIDVISQKKSKEEGIKDLEFEINLLEKGLRANI